MICFCSFICNNVILFYELNQWAVFQDDRKLAFKKVVLPPLSFEEFVLKSQPSCHIQDNTIVSFVWDSDKHLLPGWTQRQSFSTASNGILVSIFVMSLISMWIWACDELCAFSKPVPNPWEHDIGHQCDTKTQQLEYISVAVPIPFASNV